MDHNLNWVNSFPVTSMRYGIDTFGPAAWGGQRAELAVTGINVGSNMYRSVDRSGTVAGAAYAAERAGLPAIAFSGSSKRTGPWQEDHDDEHSADNEGLVYAHLAARLIDQLISSGPPPYLPRNIFLNVNFPDVRDECSHPDDFHFVLTRIDPSPLEEGDLEWCDSRRLPLESVVLKSPGCFIPVSIADAKTKRTPHDHRQDVVMQRIAGIIACLPYIDPADQEDDW